MAQDGGFPGFDEVTRHFESVVVEVIRVAESFELWVITANESRFKYLGQDNRVGVSFPFPPVSTSSTSHGYDRPAVLLLLFSLRITSIDRVTNS